MLEGGQSAPEVYLYSLCSEHPPNEVCASKTVLAMHDMTENHDQTPSKHYFGPKIFHQVKNLKEKITIEGGHNALKVI